MRTNLPSDILDLNLLQATVAIWNKQNRSKLSKKYHCLKLHIIIRVAVDV